VASVYSVLLIEESAFTGLATYDVDDGLVVIVRDIDITYGITLGLTFRVRSGSGAQFWGGVLVSEQNPAWAYWRGRQVIPGPGALTIEADGACDFRASGYLLTA
jgi:hypothetical protein